MKRIFATKTKKELLNWQSSNHQNWHSKLEQNILKLLLFFAVLSTCTYKLIAEPIQITSKAFTAYVMHVLTQNSAS